MARDFNGSSDYALASPGPIGSISYPYTFACWFYPDALSSGNQGLIEASDDYNSGRYKLRLRIDSAEKVNAVAASTSESAAVTTAAYTVGAWNHALALFNSTTDRWAYLNGGNSAQSTTSRSPAAMSHISVGAQYFTSAGTFFDGKIADAAIWNATLDVDEIAALAKGISPLLIRPSLLMAYWPLIGKNSPETDRIANFDLSLTGTAAFAHPRVYMPRPRKLILPSAGATSVTGTAALTLGAITMAATGVTDAIGTAALTLPSVTMSGAGTHTENVTGTAALSLAGLSMSGVGTETFSAIAALGLPTLTMSGVGTETMSGTGALTLNPISMSGVGTETFSATGALALAAATMAGVGAETMSGTGSMSLAGLAMAGVGTETMIGSAVVDLAALTMAGAGLHAVAVTGVAAISLAPIVVDAIGTLSVSTQPGEVASGNTSVATVVGECVSRHELAGASSGIMNVTGAESDP